MNQREAKKLWKGRHIEALKTLGFKAGNWNRIRHIENMANWYALKYANGEMDSERYGAQQAEVEKAVLKLFGGKLPGFFVNSDPRGYALKLDNESVKLPEGLNKDWGGYGILAPVF
jgi:hypothetical protein